MVYLLVDEQVPTSVMLMKVKDKDELSHFLRLSEEFHTAGAFTDEEIKLLHEAKILLIST